MKTEVIRILEKRAEDFEKIHHSYEAREVRSAIDTIKRLIPPELFAIHGVGWRSEQLPDFDVDEINEIVKDCKEKKDDLQALVCRIWNKGYMTAVVDEREG